MLRCELCGTEITESESAKAQEMLPDTAVTMCVACTKRTLTASKGQGGIIDPRPNPLDPPMIVAG
jgi:hypothetical protein